VPTRTVPLRPDLTQLEIEADELHRAHRAKIRGAAARIAAYHPRHRNQPLDAVLAADLPLADAQFVIAREYGFESWPQLKRRVDLTATIERVQPHEGFAEALDALDSGDAVRLSALLTRDPSLVHARTDLEPPYGYFTGATLLHHVAGNPWRDRPLHPNIVSIARVLLDAGADVNALTLGPSPSSSPESRGSTTMNLVITSKQASDMNLAGPLIDLLRERGATLELGDGALDTSLTHHAPKAAEKLIALGARPDVLSAAGLGRLDWLASVFDREGRLISPPRREGKTMDARDAIGLALLYAYVRHQPDAVDVLLEKDGNWDMIGVANGTALHRAAWAGDLAMVRRLVEKGADINDRNNPFRGTPMGWAHYNHQSEVVTWIQQNCAVDLHDAVAFDLIDHVRARLAENPAAIHARLDDGDIPDGTALHVAAMLNREAAARILLEHGADPNAIAGDATTPLDVADAHGSASTAALIEAHGGRRTEPL
jgi:hypothetical protein